MMGMMGIRLPVPMLARRMMPVVAMSRAVVLLLLLQTIKRSFDKDA